MTRYAYVKNLEPAWVEYSLRVLIPDDLEEGDVGGYAERMAMDGQAEVIYGPAVDSQIEGLDQEFTFQHMEKCDGEVRVEIGRGSDSSGVARPHPRAARTTDQTAQTSRPPGAPGEDPMTTEQGPRLAEEGVISDLYTFASDGEAAVLDSLRRRAGHVWEHAGCWTNWGDAERCEHCGESRCALAERLEVLTN